MGLPHHYQVKKSIPYFTSDHRPRRPVVLHSRFTQIKAHGKIIIEYRKKSHESAWSY